MFFNASKKWAYLILLLFVFVSGILFANIVYFQYSNGNVNLNGRLGRAFEGGWATVNSVMRRFDVSNLPGESKIAQVRLNVEPSTLKEMVSDLPHSAKAKYYNASLLYPDGVTRKVQYRLRGRNIWHWSEQKPSLRIKTKKRSPISIHRHLNLVNPEDRLMLANPFGEALARKFGVLAPNTQMVEVYLNDRYTGVYQLTNREDESFIRFNRRMPGPLYVGNHLDKDNWEADQFELEGDLDMLDYANPMEEVTELIKSPPSQKGLKQFWNLVDKEALAGWQALMTIISGTHSDSRHNQVFYLDPTTGKIEPVISDIMALGVLLYPGQWERFKTKWSPKYNNHINRNMTPIIGFAMSDPTFVQLVYKKVYDAIKSFASAEEQTSLLYAMTKEIESSVRADPFKSSLAHTFAGWYRVPYSNLHFDLEKQRISEFFSAREDFVLDELNKSKISIFQSEGDEKNGLISIAVAGFSAVKLTAEDNSSEFKVIDEDGATVPTNGDHLLLYPSLIKTFSPSVAHRENPPFTLEPQFRIYKLETDHNQKQKIIANPDKYFVNAVTGRSPIFVERGAILPKNEIVHTVHVVAFAEPEKQEIVLGPGEVVLNDDLFIPKNTVLKILPGTDILAGSNVSIISLGKVVAVGSTSLPITINRLNPENPWGTLSIIGNEAGYSRIEHLHAYGGSSELYNNIMLTGMISIYHVDKVSIQKVSIGSNSIGDDTLRVVNSTIDLNVLEATNCFADCIDFDFVKGSAKNVTASFAGNDGFDFMSSSVNLENYFVHACGDKGISLGELSNVTGRNIAIDDCHYGVAAKDNSLGDFDNLTISNSKIGISSYQKNWRYGYRGKVAAHQLTLSKNQMDVEEVGNKNPFNNEGQYPVSFW